MGRMMKRIVAQKFYIDVHEVEKKRAARRSLAPLSVSEGTRHFDVSLTPEALHLSGKSMKSSK